MVLLGNYERLLSKWRISKNLEIHKISAEPNRKTNTPKCLFAITRRLLTETEVGEGLAENHYGFRSGRSTIGAMKEVVRATKAANRG